MKYIRQGGWILALTCAGEALHHRLPLPIPGSIYGLLLLLGLLAAGWIRLDQVKETAMFLVEIMPLLFIPAAVGLVTMGAALRELWLPLVVILPVSTVLVFVGTGKTADALLDRKANRE